MYQKCVYNRKDRNGEAKLLTKELKEMKIFEIYKENKKKFVRIVGR
jgi:hypothetical protein